MVKIKERERERERERDRETERQRQRQTETERQRERDREGVDLWNTKSINGYSYQVQYVHIVVRKNTNYLTGHGDQRVFQ